MAEPDDDVMHTYREWATWDGAWELIDGKAYSVTPASNALHQFVVGELHFALRTYLQNRGCYVFVAPFDVFFSESGQYDKPDHIMQPDLSVICDRSQIAKIGCHGAPAMIIGVLSPSAALKDFNEKFNLYQKYGVREYWIVDPGNRTVHVFGLQNGLYRARALYSEQAVVQSIAFEPVQVPLGKLFSFESQ